MREKTFKLGRAPSDHPDYPGHLLTMSIRYDGNKFAAQATVWSPWRRDYVLLGQCVDTVADMLPDNTTAQEIRAIWKDWHLNTMTAGSPAQEAYLKANPFTYSYPATHYDAACDMLRAAGLHPDPGYLHNGKPYHYGSAWLTRPLPDDIKARIEALLAD